MSDEDRRDIEAAASEVFGAAEQGSPDRGKVRRARAAVLGFLAPIALGFTAGITDGAQELAHEAIKQISLPF